MVTYYYKRHVLIALTRLCRHEVARVKYKFKLRAVVFDDADRQR